jgi:hypothetical protein
MKIYTAQANQWGNVIICLGFVVRNSYKIIGEGSYKEMLALKLNYK